MWIRILVAGPIVVPAALQHRPWWQMFLIGLAGFGAGGLVELGVKRAAKREPLAVGAIACGVFLALIGIGAVVAPYVKTERKHPPKTRNNWTVPDEPKNPVAPPVQRAGKWRAVSGYERKLCGLQDDGAVYCWGFVPGYQNDQLAELRPMHGLANVTAIAVGFTSQCALVAEHAWCSGWNYDGSTGVPAADTHDLRDQPVRVPIDEELAAITAGSGMACALTVSGAVWCWGSNAFGEVGVLPPAREAMSTAPYDQRPPTRVSIPPARAVAAGRGVACAILRDDGALVCWGDVEVHGSAGGGKPSGIVGLTDLPDATAISIGEGEACVLRRAAPPTCWGFFAQPMAKDPRELRMHPDVAGAIAIDVGNMHSCAVLADGTAWCWGANYQGQLGDGTRKDSAKPVRVAGVPPLVSVTAAEVESCGVTTTGELWCWGHEERRP